MNKIKDHDTLEREKRKALILSAGLALFIAVFWFSTIDIPSIDKEVVKMEETKQERGLFSEIFYTIKRGFDEVKQGVSSLLGDVTMGKQ